jgi:hypothetical protein
MDLRPGTGTSSIPVNPSQIKKCIVLFKYFAEKLQGLLRIGLTFFMEVERFNREASQAAEPVPGYIIAYANGQITLVVLIENFKASFEFIRATPFKFNTSRSRNIEQRIARVIQLQNPAIAVAFPDAMW